MKNHDDIRKLLPAYCSGDLEPAERARVEEHLGSCADCNAALADLEITLRLLRTTPEIEPPPWMTSRIMARLREENAARKGWLQRFFFPLHVKLPLEFVALLMVCVSGYYLARNIETNRQQPPFEEAPAPAKAPESALQARNAPARSEKMPQPREKVAEKKIMQSPGRKPAPEPPPTPQPAPRPVSPPVAGPAPPRSAPAYAPPPPAVMAERSKSAPGFDFGVQSEAPRIQSYDRAGNAESTPRKKAAKRLEKQESVSANAMQLPRLRIRLNIDDPQAAGETIRQAINRSGGTPIEKDQTPAGRRLKARIPAVRLPELVRRLERLGGIAEQPSPTDSEGMVEVDIVW